MKVIEAMNAKIKKVKRSTSLKGLLDEFRDFHTLPLIPVVSDDNKLIGIVYPENLLDILRPQASRLFRSVPFVEIDQDVFDLEPAPSMGQLIIVDDILDTNFATLGRDDSLEDAYRAMRLYKKNRLPVVDTQGRLLGIIGIFDIIWQMFKAKEIV